MCDLSKSTVYRIITENFGTQRVCACWVPGLLTDEHKQRRVSTSRASYRNGGLAAMHFLIVSLQVLRHGYTTTILKQDNS